MIHRGRLFRRYFTTILVLLVFYAGTWASNVDFGDEPEDANRCRGQVHANRSRGPIKRKINGCA